MIGNGYLRTSFRPGDEISIECEQVNYSSADLRGKLLEQSRLLISLGNPTRRNDVAVLSPFGERFIFLSSRE